MGLFSGLTKRRPSPLAMEVQNLCTLTEAGPRCTEETVKERYEYLLRLLRRCSDITLEIRRENRDPAHYDLDRYFDRLIQLAECRRTGQYWYITPDGTVGKKDVIKPQPQNARIPFGSVAGLAGTVSEDFSRTDVFNVVLQRKMPAYLLEWARYHMENPKEKPTYFPRGTSRRVKKILTDAWRPSEELALEELEKGFRLCLNGYGYGAENASMHTETAAAILCALDELRERWPQVKPRDEYVRQAARSGIAL